MSIWTNLSPEWQQFLVGAAGNALGGLAATFVDTLLRTVSRRLSEPLRIPARQQALERAAENAITAVIADWRIPNPNYQDLWDKFGAWLLDTAVANQFRILLTPSADSKLDMELLCDKFEDAGLDLAALGAADFDALVQDLSSTVERLASLRSIGVRLAIKRSAIRFPAVGNATLPLPLRARTASE